MTLLAIITDVHANIEALEAVLEDIPKQEVDEIICLGDSIGYGPNPNEALKLVHETCDEVLLGNHCVMGSEHDTSDFMAWHAEQSMQWTMAQLEDENMPILQELIHKPFTLEKYGCLFVHGSPVPGYELLGYLKEIPDVRRAYETLKKKGIDTCFAGHSHMNLIWKIYEPFKKAEMDAPIKVDNIADELIIFENEPVVLVQEECTSYIVTVGSVGFPRQKGITYYATFDTESRRLIYHNVDYEGVEVTKRKIEAVPTSMDPVKGFSPELKERLLLRLDGMV
jgi:predicted phosphodiesterase